MILKVKIEIELNFANFRKLFGWFNIMSLMFFLNTFAIIKCSNLNCFLNPRENVILNGIIC